MRLQLLLTLSCDMLWIRYQAASWEIARRIVAKVEWPGDELSPRIVFILTNLRWNPAMWFDSTTTELVGLHGMPPVVDADFTMALYGKVQLEALANTGRRLVPVVWLLHRGDF